MDEVPYHEFREQSEGVKGVIRTAEFTPYANVRILCGCAFQGHEVIDRSDSRAAAMVSSTRSGVWAAETKAASNWLHGR